MGMGKYKPAIILTLALAVFLASCATMERVIGTLADTTTMLATVTDPEAVFRFPTGVAVDSPVILYVADSDNNRIRKIEYK